MLVRHRRAISANKLPNECAKDDWVDVMFPLITAIAALLVAATSPDAVDRDAPHDTQNGNSSETTTTPKKAYW